MESQYNTFLNIVPFIRQWVRVLRAKKCLKKYLKLRLHRRRVLRSYMCRTFNVHYIEYPLHTLIPYEELNSFLSEEVRKKYRIIEFWRHLDEEEQVVPSPPTYYSDRYFTQYQIDEGAFVYSGRSVTCRYTGMDYCGLFGLGPRGHAYASCIGWCGSRQDKKCYNVESREAVMKIVLAIKRWVRNKIMRKKRRLPLQILHKELFDKYSYSSYVRVSVGKSVGQSVGKTAIKVLFNKRFAISNIMQFL
jgi:hypothetical protein